MYVNTFFRSSLVILLMSGWISVSPFARMPSFGFAGAADVEVAAGMADGDAGANRAELLHQARERDRQLDAFRIPSGQRTQDPPLELDAFGVRERKLRGDRCGAFGKKRLRTEQQLHR